jgi:TIGR03009 family protein
VFFLDRQQGDKPPFTRRESDAIRLFDGGAANPLPLPSGRNRSGPSQCANALDSVPRGLTTLAYQEMAMRKTCLALLAVGVLGSAGLAQSPAAPPAPAADAPRKDLDNYLDRWEDAMKTVKSLAVACTRTEIDPTYKTRKSYTGTIHFLKPTYFFWHMAVKDKPTDFERFICTGTYIYQYIPAEKQIKYYAAPKTTTEGRLTEDSSLAFLFGMKATEAKARYDLKLHNVDQSYVYIDIISKNAVDRADFVKARLVLNKDSFLPRQLWFETPTQGEVLWDLTTIKPNAPMPAEIFAAPQTPKDWKLVPAQAQPRVIRSQQK